MQNIVFFFNEIFGYKLNFPQILTNFSLREFFFHVLILIYFFVNGITVIFKIGNFHIDSLHFFLIFPLNDKNHTKKARRWRAFYFMNRNMNHCLYKIQTA